MVERSRDYFRAMETALKRNKRRTGRPPLTGLRFDVFRALSDASAPVTGASEIARLTKLSLDAATAALRHWRGLKFPAPDGVRQPWPAFR
jgi:hypothetical protein